MASKITYWKCVDCNSMINDENMHEVDFVVKSYRYLEEPKYAEFCYGCMIYNPEVVIVYV